ncbi:ABC transporter ATP-binding protein [Streptococcus porcinus]|uniref:ABC transporter ATP-binding protein n=1 Tax=Streptococcus porcinus TaxID=1340 RepID=A0A7W0ASI4_STRPO|nr:ABC transporter ATP-binding protein [Streptococcus porcinus]MBA2796655.1 ABC transporter ATP-binding protein [Streptococcus porcinus]
MKEKMQDYFSLTEKGVHNVFKAAILSFLKFMCFMFPPILVLLFLQDIINKTLKPITFYLGILVVIVIVMYVILEKEYTRTYDATYEESIDLRINIAKKLKELPLSYFSTHNLAELSQTVMMDVNNIEMVISHSLGQGLGFLGFFICITLLLIAGNPILGLCVSLPIWLTVAVMFLSKDLQTVLISKYYQRLLDNATVFQDAFELQQEIKSYSLQDKVEADVLEKLNDTEKLHIKAEFTMASISSLIGVLPFFAPVLTAIIGVSQFKADQLPLLTYFGYLMAATTLSSQYAGVNEFILLILNFRDSFSRIRDLYAEHLLKGEDTKLDSFDIQFKDIVFGYGQNKIIKGISFQAKQGQVTALVGPSGSGKTTLLRLIARLYDYDSGSITIGGRDIKDISIRSLYDNIAIVFQNVELFNTSILENIRAGKKSATDEEVLAVAKLANVDKIVEKLPNGYQTLVGENGSKLSGGERQRISIARAFLKNAPIILLDEISASIDVENEMEIQKSINQLIKNKTVITVSHRLKSIEKADQIIVVDQGQVDYCGKHDFLMQTSQLYMDMVKKSKLAENYIY